MQPLRQLHPLFLTSLLFVATPVVSPAAEPQQVPAPKMAAALQSFVENHVIGGAVALVASKEKILCLEAVGYSDLETKTPMRTDNVFWIASMTKSVTGTALMMLVDEGKISLEDPVEKHLPEFKDQMLVDEKEKGQPRKPQHPITIKELMTHTHGLADAKAPCISLKDDVSGFAKTPLVREPGTKFKYSNPGIDTAGRIIEVVSGLSYGQFLQERLLEPLGMQDTTFWPNQEQVNRLAKSFKSTADKKGLENVSLNAGHTEDPSVPNGLLTQFNMGMIPTYKNRYAMPAGGLFSTATDVMKLCQMLLNGGVAGGKRYLSEKSLQTMSSIQTGDIVVNPQEGYGIGWFVQKKQDAGHPGIGSFGHRGARKTVMWVDPSKQIVMILLLQSFDMAGPDQEKLYSTFITAATELAPKR